MKLGTIVLIVVVLGAGLIIFSPWLGFGYAILGALFLLGGGFVAMLEGY